MKGGIFIKEVLISHDDKVSMYSVPNIVAEHLDKYCLDFCGDWIWKNPNGEKLLKDINGIKCAIYGASDFIDYLNKWVFPEQKSDLVMKFDFYDYEISEEYKDYPQFNF